MLGTVFIPLLIGHLGKKLEVKSFQEDEIEVAWQLEYSRPSTEGHMDIVQTKVSEKHYSYHDKLTHPIFSIIVVGSKITMITILSAEINFRRAATPTKMRVS